MGDEKEEEMVTAKTLRVGDLVEVLDDEGRGEGASYVRCAGITRAGERCKLDATSGSYCWSHAPQNAEARKVRARRGGRAGGNGRSRPLGEVDALKAQARDLFEEVRGGGVDPKVGGVLVQVVNARVRVLELEARLNVLSGRWMTPEEAEELRATLEGILRRHVGDRLTLDRIGRDLRAAYEARL